MTEPNAIAGGNAGETSHDRRGVSPFESLLQDVRFGLRLLRKTPGFTVVAILTIALGVGATTAIFTVVDKVLLRPMVYPHPDRVVALVQDLVEGDFPVVSIPKFMMWADQTQLFEDATAYDLGGLRVNLIGGGQPEQLRGMHVSANFFALCGIKLMVGRTFTKQEDSPGGPPVAVISNGLWRSQFGSDPHMVGKSIDLDNTDYTVIGVMSPFYSPDLPAVDVYIPLQPDPNTSNQGNYLMAAARLKPGVTLAQAKAATRLVAEEYRNKFPQLMAPHQTMTVERIRQLTVAGVRTSLLVFMGAVGFVLLIACANVANLLLARTNLRKREITIRAALGAGRGRIARQILTESMLLALGGGALGVFLGYFGVRALLAINPSQIPRVGSHGEAISLDWRVLLFALGISILAGAASGLIPAIKASRADLAAAMKESGTRSGTGLRHNKTRSVLVVVEMALATVLLVGAALLIRTFRDLRSVNPGFQTHDIFTMDMSLTGRRFQKTSAVAQVAREGARRLEALPGVEAAAASCCLPLEGGYQLPFNVEGRPPGNGSFTGEAGWRSVSPDYFRVYHIPLLRGRTFTENDSGSSEPVVIINETMARKYWPKGDEIGARVVIGKDVGPQYAEGPREIVGVVGDVRDNGLSRKPMATEYVPISQVTDGMTVLGNSISPMTWMIRTRMEPHSITSEAERELRIASSGLPVGNIRSMDQVRAQSTASDDFNMTLLTIFAGVALLLAAIGIYGIMAYSVQQRNQEIGIRMALGASPENVRRLVVEQGMLLALIGVLMGVASGLVLTRVMRSLLFGVKPWDPLMFTVTAILLIAVALLACYMPARRASRVDPLVALRYE